MNAALWAGLFYDFPDSLDTIQSNLYSMPFQTTMAVISDRYPISEFVDKIL